MSIQLAVAETIFLFEELLVDYVIGGSFASGAWGQARLTRDMDLSVILHQEEVPKLIELADGKFLIDAREIENTLRSDDEYRAFQMFHEATMFKIDCFVPRNLHDARLEIERAKRVEFIPGVIAPVLSAEDIVIRKLRWFVLGGQVSDRQWNDVVQVLEVQAGRLDDAYLDARSSHFNISDLLTRARSQIRV